MLPEIVPVCAGVDVTVTLNVRAMLDPQELFTVTEMGPLLDPAIALMEVDADVPLHPVGSDQLYEVAPETGETL